MQRQQMERCLEQVAAYRASGLKAKAWAEANGVSIRSLASWCAHARRWQARLEGADAAPALAGKPAGFVAARVAPSVVSASLRVEFTAAAGARLELHWPLTHTRELAALLREMGRCGGGAATAARRSRARRAGRAGRRRGARR
jgi:hypothetical protein